MNDVAWTIGLVLAACIFVTAATLKTMDRNQRIDALNDRLDKVLVELKDKR